MQWNRGAAVEMATGNDKIPETDDILKLNLVLN